MIGKEKNWQTIFYNLNYNKMNFIWDWKWQLNYSQIRLIFITTFTFVWTLYMSHTEEINKLLQMYLSPDVFVWISMILSIIWHEVYKDNKKNDDKEQI